MGKVGLKRKFLPVFILVLMAAFVLPMAQSTFAANGQTKQLFSDDYVLNKGDTGESGTGPDGGVVPVASYHPEDLRGKTIGNVTGATTAELLNEYYDGEITLDYYDSTSDMIQAMKAGKVDAYITDNISLMNQCAEDSTIAVLYPYLDTYGIKAFFPKGTDKTAKVKKEYNEFLEAVKNENAMDGIFASYMTGEAEPLDLDFS